VVSDDLENKARALFEASVERLDARTRSKLTQARNRALDEVRKGAARRRWIWAPAGGLALAAIVAVVMWSGGGLRSGGETDALALEDIDIVADSENLEMLEDVEFYTWLEDAPPDRHSG
jgi:ferric-dicitrate binding protein FerR (iron transport regulator)